MIKIIILRKRKAGVTQKEFRDYWVNQHSILERDVFSKGQIKKIVTSFVEKEMKGDSPFDGMVELYFDNMQDLQTERDTTDQTIMGADIANVADPDYQIVVLTEEVVIAG